MKELVVISGKGGTGKTSIVGAFAALAENKALADCDVDAADLHLILEPRIEREEAFVAGWEATIRQVDCIGCGACLAWCRFDAVRRMTDAAGEHSFFIDPISCEGCGVCVEFCPVKAIDFTPKECGRWFVSETRHGPMTHARLGIAEENSGKLVTIVRSHAKRIAEENGLDLVIIDGSPGIGCPVIASITGAALVLVVTEPTLSGIHDLERVLALAEHFGTPVLVCVNKSDVNPEMAARIERFCGEKGLELVGKVPYDDAVTRAQIARASVVEVSDGPAAREIRRMWRRVLDVLEET